MVINVCAEVDTEVHRKLRVLAAKAGLSLRKYLTKVLTEHVEE
jgi:predicted HicB family RNase H-like nuclease